MKVKLVPRGQGQGYGAEDVSARQTWLEGITGVPLEHVAKCSIPYEAMRGNIENPIGSVQMPLGMAGPLLVNGEFAQGTFYVPLATSEGALVRSYERGMVVLSKSGGANARVVRDENQISPAFFFESAVDAVRFSEYIAVHQGEIIEIADSTTSHGKCLGAEVRLSGKIGYLTCRFDTADAHGMNMIVKATDKVCRWMVEQGIAPRFQIFSGLSMEKRPSGALLLGGKGKTVTIDTVIPKKILSLYLRASATDYVALWQQTVTANIHANALGYCGHFANGLTALFIACGQDVANVTNSAVGVTQYEALDDGSLYASVTLPALIVGTVGGGTGLPTSRECLSMMDCYGTGKARKFAEIIGATLLAGELSMGAAIISGEFVKAHESYGRNRPES